MKKLSRLQNGSLVLTRQNTKLPQRRLGCRKLKFASFEDRSKAEYCIDEFNLCYSYWDWASDETDSHLPKAAVDATISVVKPGSAGPATIPNPLYNYRRRTRGGPTVRADTAEADLVATFAERQSLTNALFTATSYNAFSFDLEDIHNLVHVLIGGDMVDIAISAFDPIFWLHHTNVDRLMAIYQASHPNVYLTPAPRTPTYALSGPGPDDLSTPLYPFRHPDAREWTSDDVKTAESIFKYGYAYPEVPSGQTGDDLRTFAIQRVNELYGPKTEDRSLQGEESGVPGRCTICSLFGRSSKLNNFRSIWCPSGMERKCRGGQDRNSRLSTDSVVHWEE